MATEPTRRFLPALASQMRAWRASWAGDGVVFLRGVLDAGGIALAHAAFDWSVRHPGPHAGAVLAGRDGAFYQDHANPAAFEAYRRLLEETQLVAILAGLMRSASLWLLYEQIWLKQGHAQSTPWHQDLPYLPLAGSQLATVWINLDAVEQENSLAFVRGSHRGPLYNPSAFDARNPAAAMFAQGAWPALPDIESRRSAWPIVCAAIAPGDVVVFHPAVLHGGAPTPGGVRRRTISLRFFGDDACCAPRPGAGLHDTGCLSAGGVPEDPMTAMTRLPAGTLFRHPGFPCVYASERGMDA